MRWQRNQISAKLIWLCLLFGFLLIVPIVVSERGFTFSAAGQTTPQNSPGTIAPYIDNAPTSAPLTYHYGPIQDSQNIYAIFWLPSGDHFETSGNDLNFETLIERYFNDVGGSNFSKILVQYPDNVNGSPGTRVSFGGGFVDTTPY